MKKRNSKLEKRKSADAARRGGRRYSAKLEKRNS